VRVQSPGVIVDDLRRGQRHLKIYNLLLLRGRRPSLDMACGGVYGLVLQISHPHEVPEVKKFTRICDSLSVEVSVGASLFGVLREVAPGLSASRSATCKAAEKDCLERRNSNRPCVPSHVAYKAERGGNELFWSP